MIRKVRQFDGRGGYRGPHGHGRTNSVGLATGNNCQGSGRYPLECGYDTDRLCHSFRASDNRWMNLARNWSNRNGLSASTGVLVCDDSGFRA